jgi:hypothetical protein
MKSICLTASTRTSGGERRIRGRNAGPSAFRERERGERGRGVEGSKTSKFGIGMSQIESMARRLEIGNGH